ncbi:unnamed protein product [Phyllotreta striolata]|uniref:aralkylamine N-acetyltransferase n=1 Tax=Phyllotreta striolata TaxID=444603 RepID=A0A9N9TA83_PHYSR|nr:unnamed protein product [Phyllotreta striolata]
MQTHDQIYASTKLEFVMAETPELTIRKVEPADVEPVRRFMKRTFFKDEPICKSLKVVVDDTVDEGVVDYCLRFLGQGLDLVAEYNGNIVGSSCSNVLIEKGSSLVERPYTLTDKGKIVKDLLEYVEEMANPFDNANRVFLLNLLSVDPTFRGRGLGKKLLIESMRVAKEHGAQRVMVECTSVFTNAACRSLGFRDVFTLKYADYKLDGKVVVNPEPPHYAVVVAAFDFDQ